MSLLGRIGKFAKTPEGKKLVKQAQDLAKDPQTKQKIEQARGRLMHKDTQERKPATKP
jgi:AmiR/NasT family two-component response regulator